MSKDPWQGTHSVDSVCFPLLLWGSTCTERAQVGLLDTQHRLPLRRLAEDQVPVMMTAAASGEGKTAQLTHV